MTEAKKPKTSAKVGDLLQIADPGSVTRPDGIEVAVSGGFYVLAQSGTYVVDGDEVEVK